MFVFCNADSHVAGLSWHSFSCYSVSASLALLMFVDKNIRSNYQLLSLTFRSLAALHKFRFSIGRKKKVDDRSVPLCDASRREVRQKMGNQTEGV